jgi:HTH-type transcriptional regulator/antitoxin HigA
MIEIFPIRTEDDYKRALHILEFTPPSDSESEEKIEILAQMVELWEKKHFQQLPQPSPSDVLRELMLMKRTTQGQIAHLLGTQQSNVSALLTGRRKLNADQVAILAEFFGVNPSLFGEVKKARFRLAGERQSEVKIASRNNVSRAVDKSIREHSDTIDRLK